MLYTKCSIYEQLGGDVECVWVIESWLSFWSDMPDVLKIVIDS